MKILSRTFLGPNSYLTYPHCNGYTGRGTGLVFARRHEGRGCLYLRDLASGEERLLADLEPESRSVAWDVAFHSGQRLATVMNNQAWILDIGGSAGFEKVYAAPKGAKLDSLCSLSGDGKRLLCRQVDDEISSALEIDLNNGRVKRLFSYEWFANHFHYCPFDENWVAFSHEGWTEDIPDRCWVWHAEHAPEGRLAFDQASELPGAPLCVGHERWGFHDLSGYAIAYAHSPAGPRGLYEIFGDGRPAKLIWKSDLLWHCTMDESGRFVAVDTTGPIREEPFSPEEHRKYLDIFRKNDSAKVPMTIDVALLDIVAKETLFLGEALWHKHPYHPHPSISPDAKWVAWNDYNPDQRGIWLAQIGMK